MREDVSKIIPMLVELEIKKARKKHPPIETLHHGYGVLMEEVDEFWDHVKSQAPEAIETLKELVQIGAMAQRIAEDYFTDEQLITLANICRKF